MGIIWAFEPSYRLSDGSYAVVVFAIFVHQSVFEELPSVASEKQLFTKYYKSKLSLLPLTQVVASKIFIVQRNSHGEGLIFHKYNI
jgi:predicted transcriptional regulator of viral defense system